MFPRTHLLAAAALSLPNTSAPTASAQTTTAAPATALPESNREPEAIRADPLLVPDVLPQTLVLLDQAIATAPTPMLGALQAARRGFANAQEKLHARSHDALPLFMVSVLQAMAQGQAAMGQALDLALATQPTQVTLLLPAVQKVREAARRHSAQMADVALAAGASSARLAPAMAALRQGDTLHAAGNDGGAVSQYAMSFGLAASTVVLGMDRLVQSLQSVFETAELQAPTATTAATSLS